ncbi:hypothetical protein ACQP3D_30245, partial [Escherichia coli]
EQSWYPWHSYKILSIEAHASVTSALGGRDMWAPGVPAPIWYLIIIYNYSSRASGILSGTSRIPDIHAIHTYIHMYIHVKQ